MNKEALTCSDSPLMLGNRSEQIEIPEINSQTNSSFRRTSFSPNYFIQKYRALKVMLIFLSMFCVAWLPYATVALYAQFGSNREKYINLYTTLFPALFAKTGSIYNPIIYIILNKDCRRHFLRIFKKKETPVPADTRMTIIISVTNKKSIRRDRNNTRCTTHKIIISEHD